MIHFKKSEKEQEQTPSKGKALIRRAAFCEIKQTHTRKDQQRTGSET